MSRVVHVVLGESAAGSFRQSGIAADPNDMFTLRDALACGPLLPIGDVRSWTEQRRAYWEELRAGEDDEESKDLYSDPLHLRSSGEIALWLGTELGDQIGLAWLPAFLRALDVRLPELKTVQFQHGPGRMEAISLAMLNPKQIAAHPPAVSLTPDNLAELDVVWSALTSPDPDALVKYLGTMSFRFPFLTRTLREGLGRYPDASSGVNRWDARLLRNVRTAGPRSVMVIGHTLADGMDALHSGSGGRDQVGDVWLYRRLVRLAETTLREPALAIQGSPTDYRNSQVQLTPFGQRVLEGKANFVDANGIDDWVFGVHLQSEAGRVWFHRDGNLIRR